MRVSDADRERVAQILHQAMSEGRITVEELEERLSTVYAAKTAADLRPVTIDLPVEGNPAAVVQTPSRAVSSPHNLVGGRPGSASSVAVMSGTERKGSWVIPATHNSFAFWGGVEINLMHARFAEQHTTINAVAIMAGIDIVVPDDIILDVTGIGFMGAFESQDRGDVQQAPADAPVLKVSGFAFWGAVTVVRKPRQAPSQAKQITP
ncbi:DUF1707 SHOCT-like domain-containing protein [Amycolatopsis albispora]|uniref:DUF1707 domain-containing protein n=1 Tax=Amycolatopsis albispora TaxID=1804986 RepID=A0A344LG17_9PSEU|nr:DUF1707 domain-containing protein [Amycolatopsis albispora]AXB46991.1 hypothetical protein A4R43_34855 [Amycolatopsis albispora]